MPAPAPDTADPGDAASVPGSQGGDFFADAPARLRFFADAARVLASALNPDEALRELARLAVPALGDWCAIHLVDDGHIGRVEVAHRDPAKVQLALELQSRYPPDPANPAGAQRVVRTGEPVLVPEVTDAMLSASARDDEHLRLLRELALASALIVPLRAGEGVLGALTLIAERGGRRYDDAALDFAQDIASLAAQAVQNARLYEAEQRARARSDAILRGVREGITVQDRDGHVVYANDVAARMVGADSAEEMLATPIPELVSQFEIQDESGGPFELANLPGRRALAGEESPEAVVCYVVRRTGERRWTHVKSSPIRDQAGNVEFAVNILHDLTPRMQHEEALEAARREAERANAAKSEFMAVMSHELRTPLNAIMGYTELLKGGIAGEPTPMQLTHLERIESSARHLTALIEQVLSFARLEAGRETVELEWLDPRELVAEVADLLRPAAAARELDMRLDVGRAPQRVRTDPAKLRQILLNLLSNAVKYTERGRVEITLRASGPWMELEVADTGIGIAAADRERVFEPFVQAEPSSTRRRGGTGLGLSVSRNLADLLGGEITMTSELGRGSVFTLRLPLVPSAD